MSKKKVLFDASSRSGENFDKVLKKEPEIKTYLEQKKELEDNFNELVASWYMKTGVYCNMSPNEFLDTEYALLKAITKEIDYKIQNYDTEIINYYHLALLAAASKILGGK